MSMLLFEGPGVLRRIMAPIRAHHVEDAELTLLLGVADVLWLHPDEQPACMRHFITHQEAHVLGDALEGSGHFVRICKWNSISPVRLSSTPPGTPGRGGAVTRGGIV